MGSNFVDLYVNLDRAPSWKGGASFEPLPHPGPGWIPLTMLGFVDPKEVKEVACDASRTMGAVVCAVSVYDSDLLMLFFVRGGQCLSELAFGADIERPATKSFAPWDALLEPGDRKRFRRLLQKKTLCQEDKLPELAALFGWGGYPAPDTRRWQRADGPPRFVCAEEIPVEAWVGDVCSPSVFIDNFGGRQKGCQLVMSSRGLREGWAEPRWTGSDRLLPIDSEPAADGSVRVWLAEATWDAGEIGVPTRPGSAPAERSSSGHFLNVWLVFHKVGKDLLDVEVSAAGEVVHCQSRVEIGARGSQPEWVRKYWRPPPVRLSLSGVLVLAGEEDEALDAAEGLVTAWLTLIDSPSGFFAEVHRDPADSAVGRTPRVARSKAGPYLREHLSGARAMSFSTRATGKVAPPIGDSGISFQWEAREPDGARLLHVGFWRDLQGVDEGEKERLRDEARAAIDAAFEKGGGLQGCLDVWELRPRWPREPTPLERAAGVGRGEKANSRAALRRRVKGAGADTLWLGTSFESRFAALESLRGGLERVELRGGLRVVLRTPSLAPKVAAALRGKR